MYFWKKRFWSYTARQPIYAINLTCVGNEVLFRESYENRFPVNTDPTHATASVIAHHVIPHQRSTHGLSEFVNFDYTSLLSDITLLLNPDVVVIELLESIEINPIVVDRIQAIKKTRL